MYKRQAYGASRFSSGEANWPDANVVFEATPFGFYLPLFFVTFMTFVLIFSSVTMVRAVQEGHRGNKKGVVIWMLWTIAGGLLFLGCQAWEWTHLIQDGTTLAGNPFGDKKFGQFFFLITGFHGLHVTVGVIINCIVCFQAAIGTYERRGHYEMIEKVGLYWHFVELVWVYVFLAFYLL